MKQSLRTHQWLALDALVVLALLLQFPAICTAQTQEVQEDYIGPFRPLEDWKDTLQTWIAAETPIDMKKFAGTMTFKKALSLLYDELSKQGVELGPVIDTSAFRKSLPKGSPDIWDLNVRYEPEPPSLPASLFLRRTVNQILSAKATFVIRRGFVEITTIESARSDWMVPTLGHIQEQAWMPTGEIRQMLETQVETKHLQDERPLREVLPVLLAGLPKKKQVLQIAIDRQAFRMEKPQAIDVEETPVQFEKFPRKLTVATALRLALSKVATNNATWCLRSGQIVITTQEKSKPFFRHARIHEANFDKRRLTDALDELAERSGASILVDSRVSKQAQTRVTARFTNFKVETAVRILADLAGLKPVLVDNVIYVTSPDNARKLQGHTPIHFSWSVDGETFKNEPLSEVLHAHWTENLIIDPRVEKKAKVPVTAKFINHVELETAFRVLTDMAGLKHVVIDNVIYVTSPENARRLEAEQAPKMPRATP